MGLALVVTDNSVDLPTDGKPTKPTSANNFNSKRKTRSSPGSPFSAISGAVLTLVAKWILPRPPRPPLATTSSWPFSVKSPINSLVS